MYMSQCEARDERPGRGVGLGSAASTSSPSSCSWACPWTTASPSISIIFLFTVGWWSLTLKTKQTLAKTSIEFVLAVPHKWEVWMLVNLFKSTLLFPKHASSSSTVSQDCCATKWLPGALLSTLARRAVWTEHGEGRDEPSGPSSSQIPDNLKWQRCCGCQTPSLRKSASGQIATGSWALEAFNRVLPFPFFLSRVMVAYLRICTTFKYILVNLGRFSMCTKTLGFLPFFCN